ncbi:PP2C family protein-serine/threonine phosphatase [Streptomyces sp. NPDC058662]|uniref:PP2C family protein-serine/threonine phosphatase n=1 Tax=Streptomyces sp. NPDC058662 TaxID=3346583 RepID=UPI00365F2D08
MDGGPGDEDGARSRPRRGPERGSGAVDGALARALRRSHRAGSGGLPGLISEAGRELGLPGVRVLLADIQQRRLVPLDGGEALDVDGTLAGLAYRTQRVQREPGNGHGCWIPMVDGVERVGVLYAATDAAGAEAAERVDALATLAALLVVSKSAYDDSLVAAVRSSRMTLQAELLWAFVPPRTIGSRRATSSAVMEPAYDVGGDAFDHSLDGDVLQIALVDAMGHDLASGGVSAIALAAWRASRREGTPLPDIALRIDEALTRWIPERLLTGVFTRLDTATGRFSWVNCAHPPPVLIRDGRIVPRALEREPQLPLGLGSYGAGCAPEGHLVRLQPGDRVLMHTDGVTEARSPDGDYFGEERLADIVVRSMAAGEKAPEALRRLVRELVTHQAHTLRDDATILLADWHPDG